MLGLRLTLPGLKEHLKHVTPARKIDRIIIHHFYRPSAADWKGLRTLEAVRKVHVETNGWEDIGYHVIIGPDDTIWLGRKIERAGAHCVAQNLTSVGLAYASNFDVEDPASHGLATGEKAAAAICERFGIPLARIFFHRDFSPKSCPGLKMDRKRFRLQVEALRRGSGA